MPEMSAESRPHTQAAVADPEAQKFLRKADPVLAELIDARPDFRPRAWLDELPPLDAFGTLVFQVAGQQLSVASTRAIVRHLQERFGGRMPSAAELLAVDPQVLRDSGFSARKGQTLRALAERFVDGRLSDEALAQMSDEDVEAALTDVPGIGLWTARLPARGSEPARRLPLGRPGAEAGDPAGLRLRPPSHRGRRGSGVRSVAAVPQPRRQLPVRVRVPGRDVDGRHRQGADGRGPRRTGRSRARRTGCRGDPRVRRLRVSVLTAGVPRDRTGRARALRPYPVRLSPLPAHADPPACPRRVGSSRGGGAAGSLLGDARPAVPPPEGTRRRRPALVCERDRTRARTLRPGSHGCRGPGPDRPRRRERRSHRGRSRHADTLRRRRPLRGRLRPGRVHRGTGAMTLPELHLADWRTTKDTLHLYCQIVGKVRLASTPPRNQWWNVPLYVATRGLTTRRLHRG